MPIHDWTRVGAGIFHHFHHEWITAIAHAVNGVLRGTDYYALAEQIVGGLGPDVLTLQHPSAARSKRSRRRRLSRAAWRLPIRHLKFASGLLSRGNGMRGQRKP